MAYSDYGAYVFIYEAKESGDELSRREDREDTSVKNILDSNPPPKLTPEERPLQFAIGLKLDVLLHADPTYGSNEMGDDWNWIFVHAHHAVVGDKRVMVVCHKQDIHAVIVDGEDTLRGKELHEVTLPDGYKLESKYDNDDNVLVKLTTPTEIWLAYSGYGIGEGHWWQDEEGYAMAHPDYEERDIPLRKYPSMKGCLGRLLREFPDLKIN